MHFLFGEDQVGQWCPELFVSVSLGLFWPRHKVWLLDVLLDFVFDPSVVCHNAFGCLGFPLREQLYRRRLCCGGLSTCGDARVGSGGKSSFESLSGMSFSVAWLGSWICLRNFSVFLLSASSWLMISLVLSGSWPWLYLSSGKRGHVASTCPCRRVWVMLCWVINMTLSNFSCLTLLKKKEHALFQTASALWMHVTLLAGKKGLLWRWMHWKL